MPKISKELLDHVERPSLLDGLLLSRKNLTPQTLESKHQTYVNLKERPSFTPLPKSQALGKVKEFLKVMAKANRDLELRAQVNPSSNYDVEVLNDDEKEYIEMDLLLGVADLHSDEAVTAAEASMSGFQPAIASASSYSSDSEDSYLDSDDNGGENYNSSNTTFKYNSKSTRHHTDINELSSEAKRNKRPKVVMLD
ncbi:uncharacterized protein LOC110107562 [Dendrobium catenatum]|uniref:uncharacterized protein LOC110107562 n=1 Tax=Dendrobium catenatum TaxID=906689 RepID=UPI0009F2807D|nr:uncharacterized protein LOC110107562 [Dendrobium catenatum]